MLMLFVQLLLKIHFLVGRRKDKTVVSSFYLKDEQVDFFAFMIQMGVSSNPFK